MSGNGIAAVFFDLGDTLGTPVLSPPPMHLVGFNVFPFAQPVLTDLRGRGLRLGVISNTGDDGGPAINAILKTAGLFDLFDPTLLIYSKDVNLTKADPAIFRLAAERAGLKATPQRCLFVGEAPGERKTARSAGWHVAPHPQLVAEVLGGHTLQYARITVPQQHVKSSWRKALRDLPLVPLHVSDAQGTSIYVVTSVRTVAKLINMRFEVERLGDADAPLDTDLYILRDDVAATSGFLSAEGESNRFFASDADARLVLGSTSEGLVVALPPERSLEEFHFHEAQHGHTLKLLPDPSLLEAFSSDDPERSAAWLDAAPAVGLAAPDLTKEEAKELDGITGALVLERAERYGGKRPLAAGQAAIIASRHIFHADNERAVLFLAQEFQALGQGKLTVRLHRFTHAGRQLHNVEAELAGSSGELVLVTAHLDSTAAFSSPYDAATDPAPGIDDDASGMAAVMSIAERFLALARTTPPVRTIRFVLFNAEEHGLVGSRAYARDQKLANAPIVAVFQTDMVGYNKLPPRAWEIHAGYSPSPDVETRSVKLADLLARLSPRVAPKLEAPQIYRTTNAGPDPAQNRSDHASFQAVGYAGCVATEDFFIGPGPAPQEANPNYHRKEDDFIDGDFTADIARVMAAAAWVTAKG